MTTEKIKTTLLIVGIILACLLLLQGLGYGIEVAEMDGQSTIIEFTSIDWIEIPGIKILNSKF